MIAPAAIVTPAPSGPGWSDAAVARLRDDVGTLLAGPSLRGAHVGVVAIETATGRVLYARNANDEFQPASTLKLLVGSVALDELGPQYRLTTALLKATDPAAGDRSAYVLRAGGDPLLATGDLRAAARALLATSGGAPRDAQDRRNKSATHGPPESPLYVDSSRFDDAAYAPGWTWDDFAYPYAARISAAILNENVVSLDVSPGAAIGAHAIVADSGAMPPASGSDVRPDASIVADAVQVLPDDFDSCVEAERVFVPIVPRALTLPPTREATADAAIDRGGCLAIVGGVPLGGATMDIDAAVRRPAAFVAIVFAKAYGAELLAGRRQAEGGVGSGGVPSLLTVSVGESPTPPPSLVYAAAPIWQHDSEPYATWLGPRFWIPSDNLVAETLLKEVGVHAFGVPGTTANGVRFETTWLRSIGVDPATTTLADGSGLSQYDRLTPNDALAILQHDWNGPNRALVLDSLPVGGARGTIEGIEGTAAAGRVFAKTGSFSHVRALAGYLAPLHHGAVTFVFDVDDWNGAYAALAATRASVLSRIVAD